MVKKKFLQSFITAVSKKENLLAILIDPDVFVNSETEYFLNTLPSQTTHLFVGGSAVEKDKTEATVIALKKYSSLPIFLFPGNESQVTKKADGILFLSLISGRNPEYLIGQQVKSISKIRNTSLEIIATGYLLIEGGNQSAVERVSETTPMLQDDIQAIVDTALAGQYLGMNLIYLEAGSGAKFPVHPNVIRAVKKAISIPLVVGGGIKNEMQKKEAYDAGAAMVVMGTYFETTTKQFK